MEYKLKDTLSKDAFRYGYLTKKKIALFIKTASAKNFLNILIAIPLGLFRRCCCFCPETLYGLCNQW